MPRLWVCTCAPTAMSTVARPMDWPYLCTAEPAGRSRTASLWPRGTSSPSTTSRAADISSRVPARSSHVATATSSSGRKRSAHSPRGIASGPSPAVTAGSPSSSYGIGSPVVHRAVEQPVHRQVRGGVLKSARRRLVELDPEAGVLPRVQQSVDERVARLEHLERRLVVLHELVDTGLDLVDRREVQDLAEPRDPTGVRGAGAHVVDQLFGDQVLVVEDTIENLADRQRGRGLRPHPAQSLLVLRRRAV